MPLPPPHLLKTWRLGPSHRPNSVAVEEVGPAASEDAWKAACATARSSPLVGLSLGDINVRRLQKAEPHLRLLMEQLEREQHRNSSASTDVAAANKQHTTKSAPAAVAIVALSTH